MHETPRAKSRPDLVVDQPMVTNEGVWGTVGLTTYT